ncbi:MAG: 16S rRNA (guanine(527)-N(7))-methyltransferase RsmG [Bryobacterales bacterium]|nr:16S rRNA (guanine(527)-N(7))-methyltransferase RsmG [Bryobacterales bacterium]
MSAFGDLLRRVLGSAYPVSDGEVAAMEAHWDLLVRWNARLNLTAITDMEEGIRRHHVEGVVMAGAVPKGALKVADVGSGAGFPGIPFAIMRPECSVTLIESDVRKSVFLREASVELSNVRVQVVRFEQFAGPAEWVISRAVKPEIVLKGAKRLSASAALLVTRADADALQLMERVEIPGQNRSVVAISRTDPHI